MSSDEGDTSGAASAEKPSDHSLAEAVEAMVFAADEPVQADRLAEIIAEVTGRSAPEDETIDQIVHQLNEEYAASGRSFQIKEWGGGYRMVTRSALAPFVKTLFLGEQETTLSRSLLETLAVVAYRQPVTRPEVDFVRGVNSDYAIRKLMEMGLVDVEGRADSLGRPLLYATTQRFLEQFGLKDLDELPTLREVEELLDDPSFDDERAQLLRLDAEEDIEVDALENGEEASSAEASSEDTGGEAGAEK